ncbi:hypothetical protein EDD16DRAFT_1214029 [Pisolithus croceorrhizus]|nr:hypothetical protein EV401DRAFT_339089 [Pisolithus croceorrhizus]KAI6129324.1 hypothetical protein EDD16DRAFT_1214029 [Pisolithus croceorrhizus]
MKRAFSMLLWKAGQSRFRTAKNGNAFSLAKSSLPLAEEVLVVFVSSLVMHPVSSPHHETKTLLDHRLMRHRHVVLPTHRITDAPHYRRTVPPTYRSVQCRHYERVAIPPKKFPFWSCGSAIVRLSITLHLGSLTYFWCLGASEFPRPII